MLKDITLGQFFPGKSVVHRMDARVKMILTFIYIIVLFLIQGVFGYIAFFIFTFLVVMLSEIDFGVIIKSIRPMLFFIIFTAMINIFSYPGSTPIFKIWLLSATYEGLKIAILMVLRLVFLIIGTSMLTFTTSPLMLTDAMERLLSPFKKIGLPAHELAMMMSIAIRFIPTLLEETEKIMKAQKARGADFESGNIIRRSKALVPILVPLFISAFRRAEELAVAMECRCYRGGENRTRMRQMKLTRVDFFATIIMVGFSVLVVMMK